MKRKTGKPEETPVFFCPSHGQDVEASGDLKCMVPMSCVDRKLCGLDVVVRYVPGENRAAGAVFEKRRPK